MILPRMLMSSPRKDSLVEGTGEGSFLFLYAIILPTIVKNENFLTFLYALFSSYKILYFLYLNFLKIRKTRLVIRIR